MSNEAEAALRALPDELREAPVARRRRRGLAPGRRRHRRLAGRRAARQARDRALDRRRGPGSGLRPERARLRPARGARRLRRAPRPLRRPSRGGGDGAGGRADRRLPSRVRRARRATAIPEGGLGAPERIDAVVGPESLDLRVAEQLAVARPVRAGQPERPAARSLGPRRRRPADGGGGQARALQPRHRRRDALGARGGVQRQRRCWRRRSGRRTTSRCRLEVNHWNGGVEPRAVLDGAHDRERGESEPAEHDCGAGETPGVVVGALRRRARPRSSTVAPVAVGPGRGRRAIDGRAGSAIARITELLSSGARVMAVAADAGRRAALPSAVDPGAFGGSAATVCRALRSGGAARPLPRRGRRARAHRLGVALAALPRPRLRSSTSCSSIRPPMPTSIASSSRRTGDGFVHQAWVAVRRARRALLGRRVGPAHRARRDLPRARCPRARRGRSSAPPCAGPAASRAHPRRRRAACGSWSRSALRRRRAAVAPAGWGSYPRSGPNWIDRAPGAPSPRPTRRASDTCRVEEPSARWRSRGERRDPQRGQRSPARRRGSRAQRPRSRRRRRPRRGAAPRRSTSSRATSASASASCSGTCSRSSPSTTPTATGRRSIAARSSAPSPSPASATPTSAAAPARSSSATRSRWRRSAPGCASTPTRSARRCSTTPSRTRARASRRSRRTSGPTSPTSSTASRS